MMQPEPGSASITARLLNGPFHGRVISVARGTPTIELALPSSTGVTAPPEEIPDSRPWPVIVVYDRTDEWDAGRLIYLYRDLGPARSAPAAGEGGAAGRTWVLRGGPCAGQTGEDTGSPWVQVTWHYRDDPATGNAMYERTEGVDSLGRVVFTYVDEEGSAGGGA